MLRARFFDGRTSRERQVVLRREGDVLRLDGEDVLRAVPLREVEVGEATGNGGRMLVLPDGGRCELDTGPELESFLAVIEHRDRRVARWQGRWSIVVGSLLVGGVVLVAAYRVGLPWLAERLARTVPERWVQLLGTHTLATLDRTVFEPSRLGHERLEHLRTLVAGLKDPSGGLPQHVLELRECPALGANAFALPGGDIVVTDTLVDIASDDELLGALAHELGHLHARHALRQLIQSSAVATVAAYWFGDVSGLAAGVSASLLQAKYSRDFEIEADDYAARVLRASGHSTRGLAKLLARLERLSGSTDGAPDAAAYLSSHPPTAERIRRLRAS